MGFLAQNVLNCLKQLEAAGILLNACCSAVWSRAVGPPFIFLSPFTTGRRSAVLSNGKPRRNRMRSSVPRHVGLMQRVGNGTRTFLKDGIAEMLPHVTASSAGNEVFLRPANDQVTLIPRSFSASPVKLRRAAAAAWDFRSSSASASACSPSR